MSTTLKLMAQGRTICSVASRLKQASIVRVSVSVYAIETAQQSAFTLLLRVFFFLLPTEATV